MAKKLRYILLFLFVFASVRVAYGTHLLGGNLRYSYVGSDPDGNPIYNIVLETYQDCNSTSWGSVFPESAVEFGYYEGGINSGVLTENGSITLYKNNALTVPVNPSNSPGCNLSANTCIYLVYYENTVTLPASSLGYHLVYDRCCRPSGILNIANSANAGLAFYTYIPPSQGPNALVNNSPVFSDTLASYICSNDTMSMSNFATDPDGDVLVYSIETPYDGKSHPNNPSLLQGDPLRSPYMFPPTTINWSANSSLTDPLGAGGYAWVDSQTGVTLFKASTPGVYAMAIEIKEYRNGTLISKTRRDLQLVALNCPINPSPKLAAISHPKKTGKNEFTIREGESLSFPVTFNDPNGNFLKMEVKGNIFNTASTNPAATLPQTTGTGTVSSTFNWNTVCGQGDTVPYTFQVLVKDQGCPPKATYEVFRINVTPTPDISIFGPDVICDENNTSKLYWIDAPDIGSVNWSLSGGNQINQFSDTIEVLWTGTNNQLSATYTSPEGCVKGPVTLSVLVVPPLVIDAGPDKEICFGDTTVIGGSPTTLASGASFLWSGQQTTPPDTVSNPEVVPTASGYYYVTVTESHGCSKVDSVWVTVFPLPDVDAGPDANICKGQSAALQATGTGRFRWEPGSTLSNDTVPNPVSYASDTTLYVVTLTDSNNCQNSDTVFVNVQQPLVYEVFIDSILFIGQEDNFEVITPMELMFSWTPEEYFECPTCAKPGFSADGLVDVFLEITDSLGCFSFDTAFTFEVIKETGVYIPSAFSPNGDGLNDYFFPVMFGMKDLLMFNVYNRWGELVFSSDADDAKWDGTHNGQPVARQQIYVYKMRFEKYTGEKFERIGSVMVIK